MLYNKTFNSNIKYTNAAAYCLNCNSAMSIGDISIDINLVGDFESIPEVHSGRLLFISNDLNNNNYSYPAISFTCPNCGAPMLIIDAPLTDSIQRLNTNGYITMASCDGETDGYGYIAFSEDSFNHIINKLKEKYTPINDNAHKNYIRFEEIPDIYFDTDYYCIRRSHSSTEKFSNILRHFVISFL